ncbi:X-Pro dipeptidyl-peptidase [Amycolatopsis mediterranei S699]|uniref:X-Pro dipeptidyl-peptidase domain-containing protein n=2 Tax=Amycolatopsis mediterranei TaxID=33910 RepID=A0A0H3D9Y4_AMYMU|nr:CocE/NonD family hydrolase [Amycolatopsis mediterranei]ADJ47102.1 X-Pro dipeptidyl-peptidase domain-containing protein [Amycolatopsis mediterranei U32]AEK43920.1 X-Pro dipeptidyl-peptidase [Amycolatopsis mediterranei S699]AFO78813.1 X-Pro dipeptidyl-peptidase [Amycolatopsis mediterranei S699]AGT85941.1 X-Pro dipeptidyl-peptidase [Amycolatopsis mediterranei RB]UZF68274.1 CocE/NonD family hydrolase [Amycolatopsis mediterranei]
MRDGVNLAANVWRLAEGEGPTLLVRLPYGKDVMGITMSVMPNFLAFLEAGYALVVQDCRGTHRSEGEFVPHLADRTDGEDTLAWIAAQPWSDGTVGMYGASYLGMVQWEAAATGAPALKAIAPSVTSIDNYEAPWYSAGGALSLSLVTSWNAMMYTADAQRSLALGEGSLARVQELVQALLTQESLNDVLPTAEVPVLAAYGKWWDDWMAHPSHDGYWDAMELTPELKNVTAPALNIGGWYDLYIGQTVRTFTAARRNAGSEQAREGQRLIIGPWDHLSVDGVYPDRSFGPMATAQLMGLTDLHVKFFDHWVKGDTTALDGVAPVKIFVMGIDQWRDEQDWPLPDTTWTEFHLTGAGHANTAGGDGVLTTEPAAVAGHDTYLYDPRRPVPTAGGACLPMTPGFGGPVDQRTVAGREDVLCFAGPVLEELVEVTGPVSVKLFVSSSTVDTDFTAKLVDVFPDGKAINLCDGILRARYRNGLATEELMEPGTVYEITIDLTCTSNVFLPGHRIRLDVSSSNFPRYDRNTNTGGVIARETEAQLVPAINRIHHGPGHPSRLVLPIIDRTDQP